MNVRYHCQKCDHFAVRVEYLCKMIKFLTMVSHVHYDFSETTRPIFLIFLESLSDRIGRKISESEVGLNFLKENSEFFNFFIFADLSCYFSKPVLFTYCIAIFTKIKIETSRRAQINRSDVLEILVKTACR